MVYNNVYHYNASFALMHLTNCLFLEIEESDVKNNKIIKSILHSPFSFSIFIPTSIDNVPLKPQMLVA